MGVAREVKTASLEFHNFKFTASYFELIWKLKSPWDP
jgi:hypothetical protein